MKRDVLKKLVEDRARKTPAALITDLESGQQCLIEADGAADAALAGHDFSEDVAAALKADKSRVIEKEGRSFFIHVHTPPLRMMIVGAVHITQPLAEMASLCGFEVTVIDPRGAFATRERFPDIDLSDDWPDEALEDLGIDNRTAIVTLTHDPKLDDAALHVALRSEAFYIGSLGSNKSHNARVERLKREGFTDAEIGLIHAPIGLDIGAKSPAEIAVSVMAEIIELLRRGEKKDAGGLKAAS